HATGGTDAIVDTAESIAQLNQDVETVFSDAHIAERIMPSARVGWFAVKTAAIIVGAIQTANHIVAEANRVSSSRGYGGQFLRPEDEVVMFESQRGSGSLKVYDPNGNSAQSLRIAGTPENAHYAAFDRPPNSGDPYWITSAEEIGATRRFPYLDSAGSPGHVSIYGGNPKYMDLLEWSKIWTKHIFK
ncbi:MAG: hypothetical protein DRI56_12915, partial [Chloroflexota bacterium]